MLKALYRSEVQVEPKLTNILAKIKKLTDEKASRFVLKFAGKLYQGRELVSFVITPGAATATVVIDDGTGPQSFDKVNIVSITRLRSKRWSINVAL